MQKIKKTQQKVVNAALLVRLKLYPRIQNLKNKIKSKQHILLEGL